MTAYYNENDPFAAAWLRNLISGGYIARGEVDERSIVDVRPADVADCEQCHFFAGIGGWSLALRLANWPDDRCVWTGSCPCQPFSLAGKGAGAADARHLWPEMFRLVAACRPAVVFGEQVESAVRHGWLDGVFGDLEIQGYACGAAVLGAHSVGAPQIRQRIWWVGSTNSSRPEIGGIHAWPAGGREPADAGLAGRVGSAEGERRLRGQDDENEGRRKFASGYPSAGNFWSTFDVIPCRDGKTRRVEPGTFPLAHGVSGRVGKLRAYGNAIVPQVAAEFIAAAMECRP